MCLFTHFAAGALAGGATGNVALGAVAGFASHAVLDVIPHYDHPDWRLELGAGVASLLLLMLMPFVTWPAIVGGIFGMVPDLENLFQKLGKMRRDQFIYPTHTGLLPHGRTLGPRSIVWQVAIFVGCFLALGLVNPGGAEAAEPVGSARLAAPEVSVLAADENRTVLRIENPAVTAPADWTAVDPMRIQWGLPLHVDDTPKERGADPLIEAPRLRLSLAVPAREGVTWQVTDAQWWRDPVGRPELLRTGNPAVARGVPLAGAEVLLGAGGGILRSLTVEVAHGPQGAFRRHLQLAAAKAGDPDLGAETTVPSGILNPDLHRALEQGARLAAAAAAVADKAQYQDLFALTNRWVKLQVPATGLHRVTGQALSGYGVATTDVDPTKLRLFRGGALPLETDPQYPDSLQLDRVGLTEVAIEVRDGGDGEWNLDDEIRFYGVGTSTWRDRLDPAAERLDHFDHPFQDHAVYWLTWADDATASPLPGAPRRAVQQSATPTGGVAQATARVRLHFEQQVLDSPGLVQDNWVWDNSIFSSRTESFTLRPPVAGRTARFVVDFRGMYGDSRTFSYDHAATAHLNDDVAGTVSTGFTKYSQDDSVRVRLVGDSADVRAGTNFLTLTNTATDRPLRGLALDSYDVLYWTALDLSVFGGQLDFAHWGEQVATPGTGVDLVVTGAAGETPLLWDVTDPAAPVVLAGTAGAGDSHTYGTLRDPGTDRHFVAARPGSLAEPAFGQRVTPVSLRSRSTDLDYVVVTTAPFLLPGQRLAEFRSQELPGVASPRAVAVTVEDIFDNFSGGQKDPRAVRNYLHWVYRQSGMRLGYVCFLGNASRDYRNFRDRTPLQDLYDLVPTEVRTSFPTYPGWLSRQLAYAADDGLVSFDTPPTVGDLDFPDLASGRLPAVTVAEAEAMVDRAIAYVADPAPGAWRNAALFTADDVVRPNNLFPNPTTGEYVHTREAERVTDLYAPLSLDLTKLYGVDYDFPPGSLVKPNMRADINAALNRGTTLYYYVGHGAEDNLADEQVFQSRDIPNLNNGMKRPLFVAFSCDVGVFDSPSRRSMAEQFILYENGGAAGAICASQVSYTFNNDALTEAFFANLFPAQHVDPAVTVAEALRRGKLEMTQTRDYRSNSQRYNLFGEPGMILPHPVDDLAFAPTSLDTLRAGARQAAVVASDGKALLGPGDAYSLRVEESAWSRRFAFSYSLAETTFIKPGAGVFVGSGTVGSGDLTVPFKVPVQLRYGDLARVRLIVSTPDGERAAVARIPAVRAATGAVDDVVGPSVDLAFSDGRYRVRPGEELVATLSDSSGIAMLGTSPANSILLELDGTGFLSNVTGSFTYDADSYTTGRLVFPLPADLAQGRHQAALYASDALGNVGSDTLSFELVTAGMTDISAVTLFPNPTPGYCRLLFDLSDAMAVQWDIYTLAGHRLRSIRADLGAGPQILEWDGRDGRGDEIANGTYLYVLRGNGATADDREIRKTGKLVMMR